MPTETTEYRSRILIAACLGGATVALAHGLAVWIGDLPFHMWTIAITATAAAATSALCARAHHLHAVATLGSLHGEGERMRAVISTATEAIITINERGLVTTVNSAAERMFGYGKDSIAGRNVNLLMPEPFAGEHDGYLQRYIATKQPRIIGIGREVQGKRRDGSVFPIDLSVGEGHDGAERFFVAIIRDITDRHDMQAKLSLAERLAAVGELAAGVAHEINNPINTIINCAQLIADGDDPGSNAQTIDEEGQRIAGIVKDLLQFARGDNEGPQPTDCREVLDHTLRLMGDNLRRHGIELNIEQDGELPQVLARPQQLQQVLLNLLINAKDALLGGDAPTVSPRVTIRLSEGDDGAIVMVDDNGPGIPERLGNNVFEPFVTTKRARGGTGLGLSVSRSIVEGFGGSLSMQSEVGVGTVFRVWLPSA